MKKFLLILTLIFSSFFVFGSGWHIAEEIFPGSFQSGNFIFNGTVSIFNGILNLGNNRITNVSLPIDNTDVATKEYVDSAIAGGDNLIPTVSIWNYGNADKTVNSWVDTGLFIEPGKKTIIGLKTSSSSFNTSSTIHNLILEGSGNLLTFTSGTLFQSRSDLFIPVYFDSGYTVLSWWGSSTSERCDSSFTQYWGVSVRINIDNQIQYTRSCNGANNFYNLDLSISLFQWG